MNQSSPYDVVIVGGGLVGASLACALGNRDKRVAMIEAVPPRATNQPSYDDRTIALASGSVQTLKALKVWPGLVDGITPIEAIHVSDRGNFGFVRLRAEELVDHPHGEPPVFGVVAEARLIGRAIYEQLNNLDIELRCPNTVQELVTPTEGDALAQLTLDNGDILQAKLVVACDGANSSMRQALSLPTERIDYQQVAIIANVTPDKPHQNQAFERLTDTGPLAMLPHVGRRCGLVWSVTQGEEKALMDCDDEVFLDALQERFGYRLGRFRKLGRRSCYPLAAVFAPQQWRRRAVIIGNAAHTIHPVSAQGFNLGLRDVSALSASIIECWASDQDPGQDKVLDAYAIARIDDHRETLRYTDGLIRWFAHDAPPVKLARGLSMLALDLVPGLKRRFAQRRMGH